MHGHRVMHARGVITYLITTGDATDYSSTARWRQWGRRMGHDHLLVIHPTEVEAVHELGEEPESHLLSDMVIMFQSW